MTRTALIVADVQSGITQNFPFAAPVVPILETVVPAARRAGVHIVHLRAGLRSNGSDVHPNNALFAQFHGMGELFHDTSDATLTDPRLVPGPQDSVVLKRRTSGFASTDLDLVLRSNAIDEVVVCGVATSAVVAATVYAASDLDYRVSVLSDACADVEEDVHEFLMTRIFPARGVTVYPSSELLALLHRATRDGVSGTQ
ncbi:cysteine hydrolase family protein [Rhodococcus sp. 15-649-2-2]|uniref:cysteine hydrolase family protein n=1 Tax=Rhodococcus sp. 15-649-2-2 TaxID=2023140 RepID=UPI00211AF2A6|nr:isochorismatase family cysteine hydrolase [Rhodococcus sp. 15-649-2-2]